MSIEAENMTKPGAEHDIRVKFTYLNTNDSAEFHVLDTNTLQATWNTAYNKLGEAPRQGDELQCGDGNSLMGDLALTMAELRDRHICTERHFQIRSETGGA